MTPLIKHVLVTTAMLAVGSADAIWSIAAFAESPEAIRSIIFGPRRGSVMFCELTAPTPSRSVRHRAATAGDDDAIAAPKDP